MAQTRTPDGTIATHRDAQPHTAHSVTQTVMSRAHAHTHEPAAHDTHAHEDCYPSVLSRVQRGKGDRRGRRADGGRTEEGGGGYVAFGGARGTCGSELARESWQSCIRKLVSVLFSSCWYSPMSRSPPQPSIFTPSRPASTRNLTSPSKYFSLKKTRDSLCVGNDRCLIVAQGDCGSSSPRGRVGAVAVVEIPALPPGGSVCCH